MSWILLVAALLSLGLLVYLFVTLLYPENFE